jgi:hypothetical protein
MPNGEVPTPLDYDLKVVKPVAKAYVLDRIQSKTKVKKKKCMPN